MTKLYLQGNDGGGTGAFTVKPPISNTDRTLHLPDRTGTLAFETPYVHARASASQSIASGTAVKVLFGNEVYDTDSCFASSTFTAPITGHWRFSGTLFAAATSTMREIEPFLYVNGSLSNQLARWRYESSGISGAVIGVSFNVVTHLSAAGYAEIYLAMDATSGRELTYTSTRYSFIDICLVRPV